MNLFIPVREYPEAVGVMLFYRIGEYFEERAVIKSRASIMEAVDLRPETVSLVEGDDIRVIPAEDANAGDFILVRAGDRIPLDGVIVSGEILYSGFIDEYSQRILPEYASLAKNIARHQIK